MPSNKDRGDASLREWLCLFEMIAIYPITPASPKSPLTANKLDS